MSNQLYNNEQNECNTASSYNIVHFSDVQRTIYFYERHSTIPIYKTFLDCFINRIGITKKSNHILELFILLSAALLGLFLSGCNPTDQGLQNSNAGAFAGKTTPIIDTTPNNALQVYAKTEVPVLCYHRIADRPKGNYTVSKSTFTSHMKTLADSGYHSISPAQLYDYLVFNKTLPPKPVMLTFDDSREEHAVIAAPVMERYGFRGVFFIMTITYNKKNYMTKSQIASLAKAGHTIGLHSWDHVMVTKYKDAADWKKQMTDPKKELETIIDTVVEYWAYPNGVNNQWSAEMISKYFKLSFTLSSARDPKYPLQTVRRIIVPECSPQQLIKSMHRNFRKRAM